VEANVAQRRLLKRREDLPETLPTISPVLQSLLEELNLPADKLDMPRVAALIDLPGRVPGGALLAHGRFSAVRSRPAHRLNSCGLPDNRNRAGG